MEKVLIIGANGFLGRRLLTRFHATHQVYGADIQEDCMFEDERIKTYLCDEKKKEDIVELVKKTGSDIDIFIDDGSHHPNDQVLLARTILPLLKNDVIYVIEDVSYNGLITK